VEPPTNSGRPKRGFVWLAALQSQGVGTTETPKEGPWSSRVAGVKARGRSGRRPVRDAGKPGYGSRRGIRHVKRLGGPAAHPGRRQSERTEARSGSRQLTIDIALQKTLDPTQHHRIPLLGRRVGGVLEPGKTGSTRAMISLRNWIRTEDGQPPVCAPFGADHGKSTRPKPAAGGQRYRGWSSRCRREPRASW